MISTLMADPDPERPVTTVRVTRPPRLDPPYDDEDIDVMPATDLVSRPIGRAIGSVIAAAIPDQLGVDSGEFGVSGGLGVSGKVRATESRPDRAATTPTAARAASAYVRLCVEVLNGYRPLSHLRHLAGPVEFIDVVAQLRRRHNGRGRLGPEPIGERSRAGVEPSILSRPPNATPSSRHNGRRNSEGRATPGPSRPTADRVSQLPPEQNAVTEKAQNPIPQKAITQKAGTQKAGTQKALPATQPSPSPNARSFTPPTFAAAAPNTPARFAPISLARLRVSEPRDGVAEVVAVLSQAGVSCAMALRLERHAGTWICAVAQVV
jgi:hypothetical protein